ncbi:GroES-like protein [Calocera viscosa TUFC12733]|uniref:GroES-like protein n=1 Tax=Calocera viscosa (strain TUFC12733) TaxID=1330018 RepID=A0A167HAY1_CALVF|nr:GroES-like protein [Calocera viscosa TUFC12733]
MSMMRAVLATGPPARALRMGERPIPLPLRPGELLVRVKAVALNPTDWRNIPLAQEGCGIGCDFAGVVEERGPQLRGTAPAQGDRVAGFVHGNLYKHQGAFAEYVRTPADLVWSVPPNVPFTAAASIGGIGGSTAAQVVFMKLGLPMPKPGVHTGSESTSGPKPGFVVWSGASSVGQYASQLARLAGHNVLVTASPENFDYLKSLGVSAVFDYRDPDAPAQIRATAEREGGPGVVCGLDAVSAEGSTLKAIETFGPRGGHLITLLPVNVTGARQDVKVESTVVYTVLGDAFRLWNKQFDANVADREAISRWYRVCGELVGKGDLRPNRLRVLPGGLPGIEAGLELLKSGTLSAEKVVLEI